MTLTVYLIILISVDMSGSNYTPEQEQLASARLEASQEEYGKVLDLMQNVMEDQNSRLPFIPLFYRTMKPEVEQDRLENIFPKVQEARSEQYCLKVCENEDSSCISKCRQFAVRAFGLGNFLYYGAHKPYTYTDLALEKEDEDDE